MLTGVTPTEAARRAGYKVNLAKYQGHENTTKPYLMEAINQRKAELRTETAFTTQQAEIEYEEVRALAMKINQPAAASTAITGKARLYGMDKDAGERADTAPPPLSELETEVLAQMRRDAKELTKPRLSKDIA